MKPIAAFRIKCMYSKHYFKVKIFETKKDMYQYYDEYIGIYKKEKALGLRDDSIFGGPGRIKKNFDAIVMPYEKVTFKGKKEIRGLDIGETLFYKKRLGIGLISHEMLHCSLWHERLIMGNKCAVYGESCGPKEERLAYTLTGFVANFVRNYYKLNLNK